MTPEDVEELVENGIIAYIVMYCSIVSIKTAMCGGDINGD